MDLVKKVDVIDWLLFFPLVSMLVVMILIVHANLLLGSFSFFLKLTGVKWVYPNLIIPVLLVCSFIIGDRAGCCKLEFVIAIWDIDLGKDGAEPDILGYCLVAWVRLSCWIQGYGKLILKDLIETGLLHLLILIFWGDGSVQAAICERMSSWLWSFSWLFQGMTIRPHTTADTDQIGEKIIPMEVDSQTLRMLLLCN